MLKAVTTTDTGYHSKYTDILNNERNVKHSVVINDKHKDELEEEIVEELCRIFKHKMK